MDRPPRVGDDLLGEIARHTTCIQPYNCSEHPGVGLRCSHRNDPMQGL